MIVNVKYAGRDESYEFKIDELARAGYVAEDICNALDGIWLAPRETSKENVIICLMKEKAICNPELTMAENGVTAGDTLLIC